jgi:ankyrin repeat protein
LYCLHNEKPNEKIILFLVVHTQNAMQEEYWHELEDKRYNPIHILCYLKKVSLIRNLIKQNPALLNYRDVNGQTPFQIVSNRATYQRNICLMLLEFDNIDINNIDKYEEPTILTVHYDILPKIICHPANAYSKPIRIFIRLMFNAEKKDYSEFNSDNYKGYNEIIKCLMTHYGDEILSYTDPYRKRHVLHDLVGDRMYYNIVKAFLPYASSLLNKGDGKGFTPLHYASVFDYRRIDNMKILNILLEQPSIDVYKKTNGDLFNALHVASKFNQFQAVTILLAFDSNLAYEYDANGHTPLYHVFKIYEELMNHGNHTMWLEEAQRTLQSYLSYDVTLVMQRDEGNKLSLSSFELMSKWYENHEEIPISDEPFNNIIPKINNIKNEMSSAENKTRFIIFSFLIEQMSNNY